MQALLIPSVWLHTLALLSLFCSSSAPLLHPKCVMHANVFTSIIAPVFLSPSRPLSSLSPPFYTFFLLYILSLLLFSQSSRVTPFFSPKCEPLSCLLLHYFITPLPRSSPWLCLSEDGCSGFSLPNKSIFIMVSSVYSC